MIIDSHLHVWDRSRAEYAWLGPEIPEVNRDVFIDEVKPSLERAGVTGVVLVQSADESSDTEYMLEVAADPVVLGVVGWVPLEDPREAEHALAALRANPAIVGIRNLIHDRPDPDWVLRSNFDAGVGLLEDSGLPFDFVTSTPDAITRLLYVADRHPRLRLVLDHLGKPPLTGTAAEMERWAQLMHEAASRPNVYAKVSGLYGSAGSEAEWTTQQLADASAVAFETFGAGRVMYGGDWPMSTMAGGYDRVFDALKAHANGLAPEDQERFFWKNASQFYGLDTSPT